MRSARMRPPRGVLWLALALCAAAAGVPAAQAVPAGREQARDAEAFREFSGRVTEYLKLQRAAESTMPALSPTDRPELIAAHQQLLAKKIQAARPRAKAGDIFTSSVREAFRHASRTALEGPNALESRAYMQPGASAADLPVAVNAIYPETGPVTSLSPALLASFPPLPEGLAYRIVGRSVILVDVKANLVVDIARLVLSPPTGGAPAPPFAFPLDANSVRFAVIGDMGSGKRAQYDTAAQMMTSRGRFPFEFVITVGDNIYAGNSPADVEKAFAAPYKALLDAGVLFYATLGNHDDTNQRFYKPFNMNGERYYAYTKRHVRFVALDSNYMDPTQVAWLEARLRDAGRADWTIVYLHHALYSSARYHGSARDLRAVLEPLFVQYRRGRGVRRARPRVRARASPAGHLLLHGRRVRAVAIRQPETVGDYGERIRHRSVLHDGRDCR